jgi:hypothetical protein
MPAKNTLYGFKKKRLNIYDINRIELIKNDDRMLDLEM